jgi:hypothetical protein
MIRGVFAELNNSQATADKHLRLTVHRGSAVRCDAPGQTDHQLDFEEKDLWLDRTGPNSACDSAARDQ